MKINIAVAPGDGIGVDVTEQAVNVLRRVAEKYSHEISFTYFDLGGVAIDKTGDPFPSASREAAKNADAVLMGAVGGKKWDGGAVRPEQGLLGIREFLGVYANLRPAVLFPELSSACPLKPELCENIDIMIVRELTGGIYFGERGLSSDGKTAYDTEKYSVYEIKRILEKAAVIAKTRRKHVTVVDKANILETSRLWRRTAAEYFANYPELTVDYLYVDNASMQLIRRPSGFDVIATTNMFGDILSDEAAMLTGSIGMLPSASVGEAFGKKTGLYEPVHGSAPDIAGMNIANPCAAILSAAMLLRHSFGLEKEALAVENAVKRFLSDGYRTKDLCAPGEDYIGTDRAGEIICSLI